MSTEVESTGNAARIKDSLNASLGTFKENASKYGQAAAEEIEHLRGRLGEYQEKSKEMLDTISAFVRENPQHAAMIAGATGLGIGLILGLLLRRN